MTAMDDSLLAHPQNVFKKNSIWHLMPWINMTEGWTITVKDRQE